MGPGAPACEALVCTPTSCNTAATEAEPSRLDRQGSLLQMNKWLARLFVTASQVATTTGVTAALIGTQAMLVQQGEIEHP